MKKVLPHGIGMPRLVAIRHKGTEKGRDVVAIAQKKDKTEIFETMSVPKALAVMAIPTIISQIITLIYNMADTWFIGMTDNPYMVAASSLVGTVYLLTAGIANIFGVGGGSLVVRLMGGKDYEEARKVLDKEFIKTWRLTQVVRNIPKPPELLPDEYDHILWVIFPERKKGKRALIIKVYSEVLSGKRNNFPRGYFSDAREGEFRAEVCVKHLCKTILHFSGDKIAREFSHSNGIRTLARYKLRIVLSTAYTSLSDMMWMWTPSLSSGYRRTGPRLRQNT